MPDDRRQQCPRERGRQPDNQVTTPLDLSALVEWTTDILAYKEEREKRPSRDICKPSDPSLLQPVIHCVRRYSTSFLDAVPRCSNSVAHLALLPNHRLLNFFSEVRQRRI